jgi:hypothetical protein
MDKRRSDDCAMRIDIIGKPAAITVKRSATIGNLGSFHASA